MRSRKVFSDALLSRKRLTRFGKQRSKLAVGRRKVRAPRDALRAEHLDNALKKALRRVARERSSFKFKYWCVYSNHETE